MGLTGSDVDVYTGGMMGNPMMLALLAGAGGTGIGLILALMMSGAFSSKGNSDTSAYNAISGLNVPDEQKASLIGDVVNQQRYITESQTSNTVADVASSTIMGTTAGYTSYYALNKTPLGSKLRLSGRYGTAISLGLGGATMLGTYFTQR